MELTIVIAAGILLAAGLAWWFLYGRTPAGSVGHAAVDTLLNSEERVFYDAARRALTPEFEIFAKVCLADVVKPAPAASAASARRAVLRLRAEHVDFVVCRSDNGHVLGAIDLVTRDGSNDDRAFFDTVMAEANLPVLHVDAKEQYNAEILRQQSLATFHPPLRPASIRSLVRRGTVWLRIDGHGTFQHSAALRSFTERMMGEGQRSFAFDLHGCEMMDSTFLGTLTGLALRLREDPRGRLGVARANARIEEVFVRYGLDRVLAFQGFEAAPPAPGEMEELALSATNEYKRGTLLEAHEALAASSPENAERFGEVVDFLKRKTAESG